MYADNGMKLVAVLNEKIEQAKLLNALAHMAIGLANEIPDAQTTLEFLEYRDRDNGRHPSISRYPFIVLSARNGNQIRTLRQAAIAAQLPFTDFVHTMLGDSAAGQQQATQETQEAELEYFGICLFGSAELLLPLTKKFSLFRG